MTILLHDLVSYYLRGQVAVARLRDWLAEFQWDLDDAARAFADEVDEALLYLDDGHICEEDLRSWLLWVLDRFSNGFAEFTIALDTSEIAIPTSSFTATSAATLLAPEPLLVAV